MCYVLCTEPMSIISKWAVVLLRVMNRFKLCIMMIGQKFTGPMINMDSLASKTTLKTDNLFASCL